MKKAILLLIICLSAKMTFSQNSTAPPIIYKVDTILYPVFKYKVAPKSNVAQLLKIMEGFELTNDSLITHQGQAIVQIKLNGKQYAGLSIPIAVKKLSADMVESVEVIDDYSYSVTQWGIKSGNPPKKILNLNLKKDKPYDVLRLLGTLIERDGAIHAITKVRLDGGRDYATEDILAAMNLNAEIVATVDIYGDQIPHFIFKDSPSTWKNALSNK